MGFLSNLFSGGGKAAGEAVKGTLQGVGSLATDIRSAITGDISPDAKAKLQEQAMQLEQAVQTAQAQINEAEAKTGKFFIAGARPALMWVFVFSFAFEYVIQPLGTWVIHLFNVQHGGALVVLPQIDLSTMVPILVGMLGLGTMRSVEKAKGVQGNH